VFRAVLARHGVEGTAPHEAAARRSTAALITQLQRGNSDGVAARLGDIAKASFASSTDTGSVACLACTELPLAFPESGVQEIFETAGVTYLNAAAIHIAAAFERAVSTT
jgi:aspartate racemase